MVRTMLMVAAGLSGVAGLGTAAEPSTATVVASGIADIKRQPDALRVQIELMARGKTLKDALGKLKSRRADVKAELLKLGAAEKSIRFEEPNSANEAAGRQASIDRFLRQRN